MKNSSDRTDSPEATACFLLNRCCNYKKRVWPCFHIFRSQCLSKTRNTDAEMVCLNISTNSEIEQRSETTFVTIIIILSGWGLKIQKTFMMKFACLEQAMVLYIPWECPRNNFYEYSNILLNNFWSYILHFFAGRDNVDEA